MLPAEDKQQLIREHLSYVRALATQIRERLPETIELEDLVAWGTQGLLDAAKRFDSRAGASFSTYSYYRIRGAIFDGLRQMGWLSRTEYARHRVEEKANSYLRDVADRQDALGQEGSAPDSLEANLQAFSDTMAGVATIFVTSLEALPEAAKQPVDHEEPVETRFINAETSARVRQALHGLPTKERRLIELYYFEDKTLEEAGAALGLSKSWASRLHARAVQLLREELEDLS